MWTPNQKDAAPAPNVKPLLVSGQAEIALPGNNPNQELLDLVRAAQIKARSRKLDETHIKRAMDLYSQCVAVAMIRELPISSIYVLVWESNVPNRYTWRAEATFLHFDKGHWQSYRANTGHKPSGGGPTEKAGFIIPRDIYEQGPKYFRARKVKAPSICAGMPEQDLICIPLESAQAGPVKPRAKRASDEPRPKRTKTPEKISLDAITRGVIERAEASAGAAILGVSIESFSEALQRSNLL